MKTLPVMVIVCGLPGTGKTTFAVALAKTMDAVHLNTDRVRSETGRQGKYSGQDKKAIYQILLAQSKDVLTSGQSLVLDGTFYQKALRNVFVELANQLHLQVLWIETTASEDVIRDRVSKSRPYTEADYRVYEKIKKVYEPLPEGHLVLNSDTLDVDGMVHLAKAYIRGVSQKDV